MRPGLEWLSKAIDNYYATTPQHFRNFRDHPLMKAQREKANLDDKGNPKPPQVATSEAVVDRPPPVTIEETGVGGHDENRCVIC
jgi:hypothetical protein